MVACQSSQFQRPEPEAIGPRPGKWEVHLAASRRQPKAYVNWVKKSIRGSQHECINDPCKFIGYSCRWLRRQHADGRVPQRARLRSSARSVFGLRRPDAGVVEGRLLQPAHPREIQVIGSKHSNEWRDGAHGVTRPTVSHFPSYCGSQSRAPQYRRSSAFICGKTALTPCARRCR